MANIPERWVVLESTERKPCRVQGIFDTRNDAVTFIIATISELGYDEEPLYSYFRNQNVFNVESEGYKLVISNGPYYTRRKY